MNRGMKKFSVNAAPQREQEEAEAAEQVGHLVQLLVIVDLMGRGPSGTCGGSAEQEPGPGALSVLRAPGGVDAERGAGVVPEVLLSALRPSTGAAGPARRPGCCLMPGCAYGVVLVRPALDVRVVVLETSRRTR